MVISRTHGRFLLFRIAGRDFAFPIDGVVEVVRMVAMRPLPEAPDWISGLVDLRGRLLPVLDVARRLGMGTYRHSVDARIIVFQTGSELVGALVDDVVEVTDVSADDVHHPGELAASEQDGVRAVFRTGGRLVLVLDTAHVAGGSDRVSEVADASH